MRTRRRDNVIFDPSLVLYLRLSKRDGLTFPSDDAYGHLATVTGALWTPQGRSFDGVDDKIVIPTTVSLNPSQITMETWVRHSSPASEAMIVSKYHPGVSGYGLYTDITTFKIIMRHDGLTGNSIGSAGALTAGIFYHVVGSFGNGTKTIYINGEIDTQSSLTGTLVADSYDLYIGRFAEDALYWWKGLISEVRIYNRVLTPQEVQRNFLATKWRYV